MRINVAAILAGGTGSRLGGELPKQFLRVAGRTVLEHSVEAFERCVDIAEIIIVSHPAELRRTAGLVEQNAHWHKVKSVIAGGKERSYSSLNAIRFFAGRDVNLLLHDAARPCVKPEAISRVCSALVESEAATLAAPAVDTMCQISPAGTIAAIPPRDELRRVQTPQGFRLGTVDRAYRLALADPAFRATDDCGVVFRYLPSVPITIVEGDTGNVKLTYASDLIRIEHLLTGG